MQSKISFANPDLQKINQEADPIICNHLKDLDRISNDIKALEERLKASGIPFNFLYVLSSAKRRVERKEYKSCSPYDEVPYLAEIHQYIDYCLVWGKTQEGDYRLSYNIYNTEAEIDKYDDGNGKVYEREKECEEPKVFSSKPLIETKSNFRLIIEKELPVFYKMIIEALKTKREQDLIVEYSPHYNKPIGSAKVDPLAMVPF
jgi:hypothetical protein